MSLFHSKVTSGHFLRSWRPKVTFSGKVTFRTKSGFWEEFPLESALFLKGLERFAPTVFFGGEE